MKFISKVFMSNNYNQIYILEQRILIARDMSVYDKEKAFLHSQRQLNVRALFITLLASLLVSASGAVDVNSETSTLLTEMELITGLSNPDKSFAYFNLTVTDNTFTRRLGPTEEGQDKAHLAINAYATSFGSDPDIYVSKTEHVNHIEDATWHSAREGSDHCIIHANDYEIGDTLFITIRCMNECTYDLKQFYAQEFNLTDSERMVYRWGGHVTNILKFRVPATTATGVTNKFEILVEPEVDYKYIEVYLSHSLDGKFSVIEDHPASHVTDLGLSVLMTSKDIRWCTNCYVYLIVNMIEDRRIYVTAEAKTSNESILEGINSYLLANEGSIECLSYSIGSSKDDALFHFYNFQGGADFFLAKRTEPTSADSSAVVLRTKISHPQQVLVASTVDREYWGARLGIYFICAQSYDALSSSIKISEGAYEGKLTGEEGYIYNFLLHEKSSQQMLYSKPELFGQRATIKLETAIYTTGNGDQNDMEIYYKLCTSGDCYFTAEEAGGVGAVERLNVERTEQRYGEISQEAVETSFDYTGTIEHDPSACVGTEACQYTFSAFNPSPLATPRQVTFKIDIEVELMQDIVPGVAYVGSVAKGQYVRYRILDSQFDLEYVHRVILNLKTFLGDADLFVSSSSEITRPSTTEYTHQSRRNDFADQVILTETVNNWLSDYIYIGVYGELYSEFELSMAVEYHPIQDEKLTKAVPLIERYSVQGVFADEFGGAFYSFRPWWSMHENKSMILLADSHLQEVTFYLALDDYPLVYLTSWFDKNEMFALHPTDPGYSDANGYFGTYYIRVRPSYGLADLLVDAPYMYWFQAFAQPAGNGQQDLYADEALVGVAYLDQPAYYRHYITDPSMTLRVALRRLEGKGLPKLMVKFANNRVEPSSSIPQSYDAKKELTPGVWEVSIDMHKTFRATEGHPDCNYAGYWQNGGSKLCTAFIAVECQELEEMCAFQIRLELYEHTEDEGELGAKVEGFYLPPKYIPKDQDYVEGTSPHNGLARFYYPVIPEESGDLLIFVNKTAPIGQNGDVSMLMNVQTNASVPYREWKSAFGNDWAHTIASSTGDAVQPEMIDICQEKLKEACDYVADASAADSAADADAADAADDEQEAHCVLLLSLVGQTEDIDSQFRVKVFEGSNKLYPEQPIQGALAGKGAFKYYWFLSTGAMDAAETKAYWQHTIAMGIKTADADFDLYVSVMDGRYPTETDYDFRSTNFGADSIQLDSDDPMFQHKNPDSWDPAVGMVVVVGVQALQDELAEFSLVMNGPNKVEYEIIELSTNLAELRAVPADEFRNENNTYVKVYKWYNWGHRDFNIAVKALTGAANFYLNRISETAYQENAFSAIGLNANIAEWGAQLNATEPGEDLAELVLTRTDTQSYPRFCYNCWYYITVVIEVPDETEYRIWCQRLDDAGSEMDEISTDSVGSFSLSNKGDKKFYKFMLASKEAFDLEVTAATGEVEVKISHDPAGEGLWGKQWVLRQGVGTGHIEVATDDPAFHMGTYHYISIEQVSDVAPLGTVRLNQLRIPASLANGVSTKLQFLYDRELVKFAVFSVPQEWSVHSVTRIKIESLTPHNYPSIYLKKIEKDEAANPSQLDYPSIVDFDLKFGDNFSTLVGEDTAEYTLLTKSQLKHTYYTMAIYQNSYGMTDKRKPELKIQVATVEYQPSPVLGSQLQEVAPQNDLGASKITAGWFKGKVQTALEFFTQ